MKWNEVPDGVSFAMSKETAMSMRTSRVRPFIAGTICGALLVIAVTGDNDDAKTDKPNPKPGPSVSSTHNPSSN